jgi:outer membrane biosynthesis protein TonB
MVIALRIYRTHDPDLYSMFLTIGRKLFKAVVKDALHVVLMNMPRTTGRLLVQDIGLFQLHVEKVLRISINIDEELDPEIANILSKMKPGKAGLFVKQIIRMVFLEDMMPVYAVEDIKLYTIAEPTQRKYTAPIAPVQPKVVKQPAAPKKDAAPIPKSKTNPESKPTAPVAESPSAANSQEDAAPAQGIMDLMKLAEALHIE